MAVLCGLSVTVMLCVLFCGGADEEFMPPPFETEAQTGTPNPPADAGYGEVDVEAYRFSLAGMLYENSGSVDVWLTNPQDNPVWLKLRILDADGVVLGESGLLRPGEYVRAIKLSTHTELPAAVTLKLMAYEPETYYSAGSVQLTTELLEGTEER